MTIYNEAVALSKLCELKDSKVQDKKLIGEIFDNTKGLIDLYLEENPINPNLDIEEVRQILAKGLLEAIKTYSIDMVVPFSTYAYFKMNNILEDDMKYLRSTTISLDKIYEDMEACETLSSLDSLDDVKTADLKRLIYSLKKIDVEQVSTSDKFLSVELKEFLLSLTEEERENVLRGLNINDKLIDIINSQLYFEEQQNKSKNNKNYIL